VTAGKLRDFAAALDGLNARWRKIPPVRLEWYKPPRRNTFPLLRYAVNPDKSMILKVMVTPTMRGNYRPISVALFQTDGRFMFDTSFAVADADKAIEWLRRLLTEKSVVAVSQIDGQWAGSYCGPPNGHRPDPRTDSTFTRSWLGKYDSPVNA
jgi:hypothetical protein